MPTFLRTMLALSLTVLLAAPAARAEEPEAAEPAKIAETKVRMPPADRELAKAIEQARQTLPEFWAMHGKPEPGVDDFALKVAVMAPKSRMREFIWITSVTRSDDGKITGRIDTSPGHVKAVKLGQPLTFEEADIADWMFMRNGKIVGNWTLRPVMKRMPMGEADMFRSMLETP